MEALTCGARIVGGRLAPLPGRDPGPHQAREGHRGRGPLDGLPSGGAHPLRGGAVQDEEPAPDAAEVSLGRQLTSRVTESARAQNYILS